MDKNNRIWISVFICTFLGLMVDGMDLLFLSFSLSSLAQEFGLTSVQEGALGSITLIGMAAGGIIGGWAADRYGRVHTLIVTITVFSVGTAMLAFSQSYIQFTVVRFISAMGLGAEYVVANTLMAEYVPTKNRTTILGAVQAGWSMGYLVATILAGAILPVYGWRVLFLVSIIPVALAVYIRRKVPEPQAWVNMANLRRAGKLKQDYYQNKQSALKTIFKNKKVRFTFLAWCFTATFLQFGYYGVNTWMPRYIESEMGVNFKLMAGYMIFTYSAMIFGKVIAGYMADKFGRKLMFVFGCISTAFFIPVVVIFHNPGNILILLTIFGFLYGIPYGVNATYMTESFETHIRGTAVGGAHNIGRIGAAVAPVTIGFMAVKSSIGAGFLIMGVAYFICALIPALFIKEKMYNPQQ